MQQATILFEYSAPLPPLSLKVFYVIVLSSPIPPPISLFSVLIIFFSFYPDLASKKDWINLIKMICMVMVAKAARIKVLSLDAINAVQVTLFHLFIFMYASF